jgi:Calcineurin-like phosphoesterase
MRPRTIFIPGVVTAGVLALAAFVGLGQVPRWVSGNAPETAVAPSPVHFTASGDFSSSNEAESVLTSIGAARPDLHLALGDLSYGAPGSEQAWCNLVTARVGASLPFQLVAGNHESNGINGHIDNFTACLPNRLPGLVGEYGRQYYVDMPRRNPLVRFIMISPALIFEEDTWSYTEGTSRYRWTANAIDGARDDGVQWVVIGMHKPCLSVGKYGCDPGQDLLNLLLKKRVDLVVSGHEHLYARSHQLALGPACPEVAPDSFSAECVSDDDASMVRGEGTVFAIPGTGGVELREVNAADPEAPYFAAWSGSNHLPTWGNLDVRVTTDALTATFQPTGGAGFTDSFTISGDTPSRR